MHSLEMKDFPLVSIVICTFNRKNLLSDCLTSIFSMEYPRSLYEVIIVDGGSNDGTEELLTKFSDIRFVVERKYGLAYARNKGAELAQGSVVAYTDDDCIVDQQWLRNLVAGFKKSESIAGVGGPVYPLHPEIIPPKILVKPALGLFDEGNREKLVQGIITSNSAFKREIFRTVKFDESLGITRRGKLILCGEDVVFSKTIRDHGYLLLYTPHAKVYHQIQTNRIRVRYIIRHAMHAALSVKRNRLKKESRAWTIRKAFSLVVRQLFVIPSDRSFTSCYRLVAALYALLLSMTDLDRVFS